MSKVLTRRAREYFEILDLLREEGLVTHEEWMQLDAKQQSETPRMTVRTIEDALLEAGYSKGSSNEQKKYRLLWMQERGLIPEEKHSQTRLVQDDPLFGAAVAIRKQLQDEATRVISEEKRKTDEIVQEVNAKYSNLQTQLTSVHEKYSEVCKENTELKSKSEKTELELLQTLKNKVSLEAILEAKEKELFKEKENFENKSKEEKSKYDALVIQNKKEIDSLIQKHQDEVSTIKEYSERQRHDHVVEIENSRVAKKKLEADLEKARESAEKLTRTNIELTHLTKRLEDEITYLRNDYKSMKDKGRTIEREYAETKGELKQLQFLFNNQRSDYQKIQSNFIECKEQTGRLEEQLQQTKNELAKIERGKLKKETNLA